MGYLSRDDAAIRMFEGDHLASISVRTLIWAGHETAEGIESIAIAFIVDASGKKPHKKVRQVWPRSPYQMIVLAPL